MTTMPETTVLDTLAWITSHKVCWELTPLNELVKGHGVGQTGYVLTLYGRLYPTVEGDAEPRGPTIHQRLHALAAEALRELPIPVLVDAQPFGRLVVTPESSFVVDVELAIAGSPPDPDVPRPPAEVKAAIRLLEERLRSMGLRKRG
jgi:hypothetical protein